MTDDHELDAQDEDLDSGEPVDHGDDEVELEASPKRLEIPLDGDTVVKVGDWEGPASTFRKAWLPQSAVQQMRERDKQRNAQELAQARQQLAEQQRREQYLYQQQQGGRQQQANPLSQLFEAAKKEHGGYIHATHLQQLVGMFQQELAARDQRMSGMAQALDQWYGDYNTRVGSLDKLTNTQAETEWTRFIDNLTETADLPRATVERIASSYQPGEDEYGDILRMNIEQEVRDQANELRRHLAKQGGRERAQNDKARQAGIAGTGGRAAPSKRGKPMRSAEEIANRFFDAGGRPA